MHVFHVWHRTHILLDGTVRKGRPQRLIVQKLRRYEQARHDGTGGEGRTQRRVVPPDRPPTPLQARLGQYLGQPGARGRGHRGYERNLHTAARDAAPLRSVRNAMMCGCGVWVGRHGLFERGALAHLAGAADGVYETLLEDIVTPRLVRVRVRVRDIVTPRLVRKPADACNVSLHT